MNLELSPLQIFQQATGVVQLVVILLALASLIGWAVILEKLLLMGRLRRQVRRFEQQPPDTRPEAGDDLAAVLQAAALEALGRRHAGEAPGETRDRIERRLRETQAEVLMAAEQRLPYLATIASAAPFIGLFGTVWGIMHAFLGIARNQDTSLATVAPGIAEALAATAIGLLTAIPAAIAYNKLAGDFSLLARRLNLAIARRARQLLEEEKPCSP